MGHQPGADQRREPGRGRSCWTCAPTWPLSRIPLDLFTAHPELLPEPLATAAADELAFNEAIGTLVDYSLVKRTAAGLQIHRLVQGAIRARHAAKRPPLARPGDP